MKLVAQTGHLGELPYYISAARDAHASTVRGIFEVTGDSSRKLDLIGLRRYFERKPDGERTCFERARLVRAGSDLFMDGERLRCRRRALPDQSGELLPLLETVMGELLPGRKVAIALSGGLDSALVLALVTRLAGYSITVLTLATNLPGYCELADTLETARLLGIESVDVVQAGEADLIAALPDAIAACETPLFNLHPVARFLLARAAAERGFSAILTGDGADQVFAGSDPRNYIPIVGAMVRSTCLEFLSPFFDERIVAWAARHSVDLEKSTLRQAANKILPSQIALRRKVPRLAPELDVNSYRNAVLEEQLAPRLALTVPGAGVGSQQTLWATTALLVRHLGGTC